MVEDSKLNYKIYTGISNLVSKMNSAEPFSDELQIDAFVKAQKFALDVMSIIISDLYRKIRQFDEDYKILKNSFYTQEYRGILVFEKYPINFLSALYKYEEEHDCKGDVKFIIL